MTSSLTLSLLLVFTAHLMTSSATTHVHAEQQDDVTDQEADELRRYLADVKPQSRDIQQRHVKPSGCPRNFIYVPSVNGCYKLILERLDWSISSVNCRWIDPRAHLLVVDSGSEQRAVVAHVLDRYSASTLARCDPIFGGFLWTAGQRIDPKRESAFVWKIVSDVEYPTALVKKMAYTNWKDGEPSYSDSSELCAHLWSGYNYQWNDWSCAMPICSVCEIDMKV